jgi:hypothetical protein
VDAQAPSAWHRIRHPYDNMNENQSKLVAAG